MTKPQLDVRDLPLAQAGASFRPGRARSLLGLSVAGAAAFLALWLWLSYDDEARVYGELGRKLNGVRQSQFEPFWQCVLEDVNLGALSSNTELLHWLRVSIDEGGTVYGEHLRGACTDLLSSMQTSLDQLIVPADLKQDIATLQTSTAAADRYFRTVTACLMKGAGACSASDLEPELLAIARTWFDFQAAHASINRTIRGRLEKP